MMSTKMPATGIALMLIASLGLASESKAATIGFDLTSTVSDSLSSLVYTSGGVQLTATPNGASLINRNTNGLCVFSNRTGCGVGDVGGPFISGTNFQLDTNATLTGFTIKQTNICGTDCTPSGNAEFNVTLPNGTYGPFSFGQGEPIGTVFQAVSPLTLIANTPFLFGTSTLSNPQTGYQYRISSITFSTNSVATPAPLGIAGVMTAFSVSRKLRKKINAQ